MQADEGVAPVVAVALLIGLVAVAGAIIGLSMFAALEDASGTLPDVRFQASADNKSLYHAGGDALPLKNLVFYDTSTRKSPQSVQLTKNGQTKPETSLEGEVWETGDKITFGENVLKALSIVGLDSRNHPALLYMGVDAAVLPIGDMVPDEWKEQSGGGDEPQLPDYPYPDMTPENFGKLIQNNQGAKFDNTPLFTDGKIVDKINYNVTPDSSVKIKTTVKPAGGNSDQNTTITVNVYSRKNTEYIPIWNKTITDTQGKNEVALEIPNEELEKGDLCYVTIYREIKEGQTTTSARKTVVITLIH